MPVFSMISANLAQVRPRIEAACARAERHPDDIVLVAVAKTFPAEHVRAAVQAGIRDIGENYVQELLRKRAALPEDIRWHFIGHLQTNKVKQIAGWIHLIHALESISLARELDLRAKEVGRTLDVLVEVNTTGEQTKFGVSPDALGKFVQSLEGFSHLRIAGLMTIGPFLPDPEGSRPMFRQLRQLRDDLTRRSQQNVELRHLSMGMTGDFEVAIEEGATIIRIGTAIFGSRTRKTTTDDQPRTP
jgi:PLP dependent protein